MSGLIRAGRVTKLRRAVIFLWDDVRREVRAVKRAAVKATLYTVTGALFAYGTFTVLTYKVT